MLSSTDKTESETSSYRCSKCKDEEVLLIQREDGREYAVDCICKKDRRIERMMKSSKITKNFQQRTFKNFTKEGRPKVVCNAYDAAWNYVMNFTKSEEKDSIALLGRSGCGKTHLLMAISNNLISKGIGVVYFPWVEGFNELRSNLDTLDERIRVLQQTEVLFLDDLFKGQEKVPGKEPTKFQLEQLFAIINYRYLEQKPILFSSEKTIAQLCGFDEAIGSRIAEMSRNYRVVLAGGIDLNYRLF